MKGFLPRIPTVVILSTVVGLIVFWLNLVDRSSSGRTLLSAPEGRSDATLGGPEEPVRYVGKEHVDDNHNGGLRPAVGVKTFQAFRANRAYPSLAEDYGWTYNHAPMLAYWNGKFYLEYLSSPVSENFSPMQTLLLTSADGETWDKPRVVFPQYRLPNGRIALVHQRMGFYVAPNGRLLVLGFYGLGRDTGLLKGSSQEVSTSVRPTPNDGSGIGRVTREVYKDGTFSSIYFVRYNAHNGWNETNTLYPFVWYDFQLRVNAETDRFDVAINGKTVLEKAELLDPVRSLERVSFRTGPYRVEPLLRTPKSPGEDLPAADDAVPLAVYYVDDFEVHVSKAAGSD